MKNIWDMTRTIDEAGSTLRNADIVAREIAPILRGRLRHCWDSDLAALKKELRDYNIHTGTWKELGHHK